MSKIANVAVGVKPKSSRLADSQLEAFPLSGEYDGKALLGRVEHGVKGGPIEGATLTCTLDLDKLVVPTDDVHVDSRTAILFVVQIADDPAIDYADTDGTDLPQEIVLGAALPLLVGQLAEGVVKSDPATGYRRGSCSSVGLQDITVNGDQYLPKTSCVYSRPETATDQP